MGQVIAASAAERESIVKRIELTTEVREAFALKEYRPLVDNLRDLLPKPANVTVYRGQNTEELVIECGDHGLTIELGEADRSTIVGVRTIPVWTLSETRTVYGGHWEPDSEELVELSTHYHWRAVVREVLIVIATRDIDGVLENRAEAESEAEQERHCEESAEAAVRGTTAVNVYGDWIPTDQVEILDISEGIQGDILTFRHKGETYERTVCRR